MFGNKRYSLGKLIRESRDYHTGWQQAWPDPTPKKHYDVVIIGGGGHGLGTAYYLAKEHGITNVAVIEKGWLGGGNTGRNTTIIRSNYLQPESIALYDHSVKLFETLSEELNYNIMFSSRSVLHLAHTMHDLHEVGRRGHSIWANGVDSELLSPAQVKAKVPTINLNTRFPIMGGLLQRRAGNARHDAVAWGYARAAAELGVDIIQQCAVTGFTVTNNKISAIETTKGNISAGRVGAVVAGHAGVVAGMAGLRLPLESFPLQAFVSEPLKPILDCVVMSGTVHVYASQSDKGELVIGAGSDHYVSYAQRGSFNLVEEIVHPMVELFPFVSRLRMLRQWAGIVDVTIDRSPILSKTPVDNFYVNCGWGTGGFKATPGSANVFAASLAGDDMHPFAKPFSLERFATGAYVDEGAASGVAH
ncbi:MAG: sarcosine oxidase subunit beta family protein [Alphaproteobacteria bacterium]|nr:sarcosine oxidase subunit beta family protein [Alphaproteobacteria bacterium]